MIAVQTRMKTWAGLTFLRLHQIRVAAPPAASTRPQWNVAQAASNDQARASWTVVVIACSPKKAKRLDMRRL
ncbi:MAG: hypothetical protein BWX50_01719 [Euryarchaeota archaeon ADurb.Bin009]|nr:MAG: hypothetical protein BWX50_01719 [Euryarchaeota archaeon ADurb.Bin009]